MSLMTPKNSEALFSDSVHMEILLRSLLKRFENSQGWWIAIPGSHMRGGTVIPFINLSVWPAAIRLLMRERLIKEGGVPLEYPLTLEIDNSTGKLVARQVKNRDTNLTATLAELATDDADPQ